jgi:hypothetical protein
MEEASHPETAVKKEPLQRIHAQRVSRTRTKECRDLVLPFLLGQKFSGAVGYADTSEVEFLLAGKGESASETGSFNMLLRNGEHILARYC